MTDAPNPVELARELKRLSLLQEKGELTDAEYQDKRKSVLVSYKKALKASEVTTEPVPSPKENLGALPDNFDAETLTQQTYPPSPPQSLPVTSETPTASNLEELQELLDRGVITPREYVVGKARFQKKQRGALAPDSTEVLIPEIALGVTSLEALNSLRDTRAITPPQYLARRSQLQELAVSAPLVIGQGYQVAPVNTNQQALMELAGLREAGVIPAEEFVRRRDAILGAPRDTLGRTPIVSTPMRDPKGYVVSHGLGLTTMWFFIIAASFLAVASVPMLLAAFEISDNASDTALREAAKLLVLGDRISNWASLPALIASILFVIWLFQASRKLRNLRVHCSFSPGWSIGAWFIPIVNIVLVPLVMRDVIKGSSPSLPPDSHSQNTGGASEAWFSVLLGITGYVMGAFGTRLVLLATSNTDDRAGAALMGLGSLVLGVSMLLFAYITTKVYREQIARFQKLY